MKKLELNFIEKGRMTENSLEQIYGGQWVQCQILSNCDDGSVWNKNKCSTYFSCVSESDKNYCETYVYTPFIVPTTTSIKLSSSQLK